jgi:hypothetical protein
MLWNRLVSMNYPWLTGGDMMPVQRDAGGGKRTHVNGSVIAEWESERRNYKGINPSALAIARKDINSQTAAAENDVRRVRAPISSSSRDQKGRAKAPEIDYSSWCAILGADSLSSQWGKYTDDAPRLQDISLESASALGSQPRLDSEFASLHYRASLSRNYVLWKWKFERERERTANWRYIFLRRSNNSSQ